MEPEFDHINDVRTSYTDLKGEIAVDFPGDLGRTEFANYAEVLGFDLEKYRPEFIRIHGPELNDKNVSIYAVDKVSEAEGKKCLVLFRHVDTFANFLKHVHRLDILLGPKHHPKTEYAVIDEYDWYSRDKKPVKAW